MHRFVIALLLCFGIAVAAENAQAQNIVNISGYLLPGQTMELHPRVPNNTLLDTIYQISGVFSVSGRLQIDEYATVYFLPNSRIVDSSGGKIIANGFTGLQRRILFQGQPVNANSVEWGHFLILPGADSSFFANVRFVNFRKLNTVDDKYIYGTLGNAPILNSQAIMAQSNGTGACIATFSQKTYIYDAIVDSCVAIYRGGAFAFLQAPAASYYPADDGRLALANSQVRKLLIRGTHALNTDATMGAGQLWSGIASSAMGGAIYIGARTGATSGNYLTGYLGNRPGPFFPQSLDTLIFENCTANNTNNNAAAVARGGAIEAGSYSGLVISQASFNTDSAIAAYQQNGGLPQTIAFGGAIDVSPTSGSPFFLPPPAPGFDHLPGLAILKRANFNECVAGYGGALNLQVGSSSPVLNIDGENFNGSNVRDSGLILFNGNTAYYDGGAINTGWYTYIKGYLAPSNGVYDPVNQVEVPETAVELRVKFFNNVAGQGGGSIFLDDNLSGESPNIQNRRVWHLSNSVNPGDSRISGVVNPSMLAPLVIGGGAEYVGLRDSTFATEYNSNFSIGGNGGAVNMTGPQGATSAFSAFNRYFVWDQFNVLNPTIEPLPFDQRQLTRFVNNHVTLGADSASFVATQGRGGALYINVTDKYAFPLAEDSTYFVRTRIEDNSAFTGSAIYSDNYNLRLVTDLTLIANNQTTSGSSRYIDLNNLKGNPADTDVSATIWGELEGPLPGYESNSRGNAIYDNHARYVIRLPSSANGAGVGFGGTDTVRGNFWGATGPNIITVLPSGALQSTFFVDYYTAGCIGSNNAIPPQTYEVYEQNRTPNHSYTAIPVGTIPDTLLMEGRVYDIFDAGTDIKTIDYSVRRMAISEDFALGEPTDIGFGNQNLSLDHHGLHSFTRNFFDTNSVYVQYIMAMQTDFVGPHPIGYPLFLEADVDTNDINRDPYAKNYTTLFVINTTTNEFVRVNAKEIVADETTGQIARYRGRLDFVPDSVTGNLPYSRHPQQRANVLWTLSLLRPLTTPFTFAEIQRAAKLEDSAALAGRIYELGANEIYGPGADSLPVMGPYFYGDPSHPYTTWYAGERYRTLPVRPGDNIVVVSRTQLWKYGAAGAIARGLQFPIGDVLPPQFSGDITNLQNNQYTPNDLFLGEDSVYDNNHILLRVSGYDVNSFYDPRFQFNPALYTQLQITMGGYKTTADSNDTRIAWWLKDTTLFNVNATGSNGYVLLSGTPHNPDVVPGGEVVRATITNYPPDSVSESGLLNGGFNLGPDADSLSMWTYPPYFNCPDLMGNDTINIRRTSTTYAFRIFVKDSVPIFLPPFLSDDVCPSVTAVNLTDFLRFQFDINSDDELEDSTAGAITAAWAAKNPNQDTAFNFRYGRTSYSAPEAPEWFEYGIANRDTGIFAQEFSMRGIINIKIDSATAITLLTPTPQVNGELNLDSVITIKVDDGHTGVRQMESMIHVNVPPVIITDTLPWAKEDTDYAHNYKDPNNVPVIQITDANFADFHTFRLLYKGSTDTEYEDNYYKPSEQKTILVGTTPSWLKIDQTSGELYGTPADSDAPHYTGSPCHGADTALVIVTDCGGLATWKYFPLNVDSTNHDPGFVLGPRTICVMNKQPFCDTIQVYDQDLLRPGACPEVLTITALDKTINWTVTPGTITGPKSSDTQSVAICGEYNFDDTYFSQVPLPPDSIIMQVTDKSGATARMAYQIYVGDQPTFECAVSVSNIGTSTHPSDVQILCFGAGKFGTDSLDIRYCEFEVPPPGPASVFDARWELPIGGSEKGTYIDIRRDTEQYTEVTWQIRFQSGDVGGTFLYPVYISWRPSCLDSTGSMVGNFYLQNPFDPSEFSINMRTGLGPINLAFYKLIPVGSDSMQLQIRNVGLSNARIVFVPAKAGVATTEDAKSFALEQSYPNPFTNTTTMSFSVARPENVQIDIYDIKGTVVRRLVNEHLDAGTYPVSWDGADASGAALPSGTYVAKMTAGSYSSAIKMTLKR